MCNAVQTRVLLCCLLFAQGHLLVFPLFLLSVRIDHPWFKTSSSGGGGILPAAFIRTSAAYSSKRNPLSIHIIGVFPHPISLEKSPWGVVRKSLAEIDNSFFLVSPCIFFDLLILHSGLPHG